MSAEPLEVIHFINTTFIDIRMMSTEQLGVIHLLNATQSISG